MELIIKLNNQSNGRDKLARVVQYASRLVWYELQNRKSDRYTIEQIQRLETTCSSFRKLLRFGRFADSLYSAAAVMNHPDKFVRLSLTLSKITNALFLYADHLVWLTKSGFLKRVDAEKWNKIANKYWFMTIFLNLLRDCYEIYKIFISERSFVIHSNNAILLKSQFEKYNIILQRIFSCLKNRKDITTDIIKNACDVWIPLNGLGTVKLQPSTIGILGTVSSIAGLLILLNPSLKLSPS